MLIAATSARCASRFNRGAAPDDSGRGVGQQPMGSVENAAGRDLPDLIGEPDSLGNLGIGETGLSRFRDVVLDAGHTVAAHCSTKCHQFAFTLVELVHAFLLSKSD
jgi:hypothetical protein